MPIITSYFSLFFLKKLSATGPNILQLDLIKDLTAGLIIFSSSLKASILSQ